MHRHAFQRALRSFERRSRIGTSTSRGTCMDSSSISWDLEHAFSDGSFLERREDLRTDRNAMIEALSSPSSRWLLSNAKNHFLLRQEDSKEGSKKHMSPLWLPKELAAMASCEGDPRILGEQSAFLGISEGIHYFSVSSPSSCMEELQEKLPVLPPGAGFFELRKSVSFLSPAEATVLGYARSLHSWNSDYNFCPKCGSGLQSLDQGHRKFCAPCKKSRYPVIMPCVIMLVVSPDGELCLLGRKSSWKEGVFSCLAGFMELGETAQNAASREVFEEAFVECVPDSMDLVSTQPWPFDANLMIGCQLVAKLPPSTTEQPVNQAEGLAEGRWFTKAEARAMLARSRDAAYLGAMPNEGKADGKDDMRVPGPHAIAHTLIKRWAESQ